MGDKRSVANDTAMWSAERMHLKWAGVLILIIWQTAIISSAICQNFIGTIVFYLSLAGVLFLSTSGGVC